MNPSDTEQKENIVTPERDDVKPNGAPGRPARRGGSRSARSLEVADALSFSVDESNGSGILEEQKTGGNVDWEAEEASLALARQLMEEESMMAYRHLQQASVQAAMSADDAGMDEDTALAVRMMREEMAAMGADAQEWTSVSHEAISAYLSPSSLSQVSQVAFVEEEKEQASAGNVDVEGMGYDELLQLGEELGDVRRERWRIRARTVISSLPEATFRRRATRESSEEGKKLGKRSATEESDPRKRRRSNSPSPPALSRSGSSASVSSSSKGGGGRGGSRTSSQEIEREEQEGPITSWKCLVCQCEYEEGESIRTLPCKHQFHRDCIDRWLESNWTCCLCKKPVAAQ